MEGRVEVGKKKRVSEVRREMLPYVQNRLEDIEIKEGQRYFVNHTMGKWSRVLQYVQRCQMFARSPLCFIWLSNSLSFLSWYSCAILNCMGRSPVTGPIWRSKKDRRKEWEGWEVAMFTVQKMGSFEERTWYNYWLPLCYGTHYFLVRVFWA